MRGGLDGLNLCIKPAQTYQQTQSVSELVSIDTADNELLVTRPKILKLKTWNTARYVFKVHLILGLHAIAVDRIDGLGQ